MGRNGYPTPKGQAGEFGWNNGLWGSRYDAAPLAAATVWWAALGELETLATSERQLWHSVDAEDSPASSKNGPYSGNCCDEMVWRSHLCRFRKQTPVLCFKEFW